MSVDIRSSERRRYINELNLQARDSREKEIAAGLLKVSQPESPKGVQETDKRMRREIANSNERRRMQCINAGFSSLRSLIPQLEGEKLSKAAILQHTTEYIAGLVKDKARLQMQLDHLNRVLSEMGQERVVKDSYMANSPPPSKRKKRETESSDEGVGSLSDASDEGTSELRQEIDSLRSELAHERQRSSELHERNLFLESHVLPHLPVKGANPTGVMDLPQTQYSELTPVHQQEPVYHPEVVEVVAAREEHSPVPQPEPIDYKTVARPLVPYMEHRNPVEVAVPACTVDSLYQLSSAVKMEMQQLEAHTPVTMVAPTATAVSTIVNNTNTSRGALEPQQRSPHLHTYCHRDHPRRRRHQAQLERQRQEEEELRQQEEEQRKQQQQQLQQERHFRAVSSNIPRPPTTGRNLENLVEAIRHIEGEQIGEHIEGRLGAGDKMEGAVQEPMDTVLCNERKKLYEGEEQRLFIRRQAFSTSEESERDTSSISDQEEMKSESSGRDSPLQHQHSHLHQQQQQQIHNVITSHSQLHRLLHAPIYRPGVIVQKL